MPDPALPAVIPDPDTLTIQTFHPTPPATIPAFPEQSNVAVCSLTLPMSFSSVKSSCGKSKSDNVHLHKSRCCPVLAAWLYSAYSATALSRPVKGAPMNTTPYDLPLLPDDSETCVDSLHSLQKELNMKGIKLMKPNETCDVVYCYCGIRLHPLTCSKAFSVTLTGELSGHKSVKKLERDCLIKAGNGYAGLGG